jgi:hypothetical protein
LRVAHEVIGTVGGPLDGLAQFACGNRDQGSIAIGKPVPKPPPTSGRSPHLLERDLQLIPPMISSVSDGCHLAADRERQMVALGVHIPKQLRAFP